MFNDTLREKLQEILRIVEYQKEPLSVIERDLLLEKLRRLYEEVLKMDAPSALPLSPLPPIAEEEPQPDQVPAEPAMIPAQESPIAEQEEPMLPPIEIPDWDEMIPLEMPFEEEPAPEEQPEEQPVEEPVESPEPEPEPEELPEPEPEPEVAEEPDMLPEPEVLPEPEPEALPEPESEEKTEPEPEVLTLQNSLFDPAEIPVSRRSSRRVLRSLYGEEPRQAAPTVLLSDPQPEALREVEAPIAADQQPIADPVEEPAEELEAPFALEELPIEQPEQPMVVGEALQQDHLTIADTIPPTRNVASAILPEGKPLREMISLGDSYLMIKELFYDNKSLCLETLDLLDGMETLDDCLIHIAENYTWNPNSEGVKRLQELLERKFGEN